MKKSAQGFPFAQNDMGERAEESHGRINDCLQHLTRQPILESVDTLPIAWVSIKFFMQGKGEGLKALRIKDL